MSNKTLVAQVDPKEYGLEPKKANELFGNLPQIKEERKILTSQYKRVIKMDLEKPETLKTARELRLMIRDNRTKGLLVWHKTTKDFFLKGGQFIDAIKNVEVAINEGMEAKLSDIENYYLNLEKEKQNERQVSRALMLSKYVEDAEQLRLGDMEEDVWEAYLTAKKNRYEANLEAIRIAEEKQLEAERLAEQERLEKERKSKLNSERKEVLTPYWSLMSTPDRAIDFGSISDVTFKKIIQFYKAKKQEEDKKQEEIRKENERLKKEAELKSIADELERQKLIKERELQAEKKRKEDAEKAKALAKEREEAKAQLQKEREEREKIVAELKAKQKQEDELRQEIERKANEAKLKAEQEAKAPIQLKMKNWVNDFQVPVKDFDNDVSREVILKFNSFKKWAETKIQEL